MKIYLSGLISSNTKSEDEIQKNKARFFEAEKDEIEKGNEVFNPARLECDTYEDYIYQSMLLQKQAEATLFLPKCTLSYGSSIERINAKRLGHIIIDSDNNMSDIMRKIERVYGVDKKELIKQNKSQEMADIRHIFSYICRRDTGESLATIGAFLNRNHATIIHSVKCVKNIKQLQEKLKKYDD